MQDYQLFLWLPDVQKAVIGMPRATPCAQQAVRLLRVASHRRCIRTEIQAPMRGKRGNRGPSSNTRWSRGAKGKVHYQILRHHCIASSVSGCETHAGHALGSGKHWTEAGRHTQTAAAATRCCSIDVTSAPCHGRAATLPEQGRAGSRHCMGLERSATASPS